MSMTFDDFRVNFGSSWLGFRYKLIKDYHSAPNVTDNMWIPATYPNSDGHNMFTCKIIIPTEEKKPFQGSVRTHNISMKWKEDLISSDNPDLFLEHPEIGMVQGDTSIAYLMRKAVRQRNRGYCPRYTTAWVPNIELFRQVTGTNSEAYSGSHRTVWGIYNPKYTDITTALTKLEEGECFGFALSRLLGVAVEDGRKFPLISYRDDIIGLVDANGVINVNEEFASESVLDYILKVTGQQAKTR